MKRVDCCIRIPSATRHRAKYINVFILVGLFHYNHTLYYFYSFVKIKMRTGSGLLRRLRLAWAKSTLHDLEWFCGTWVLVPVFAAVLLGGAVVEFAGLHRYGFLYELARADGRSTFADPLSEAEAFLSQK